MRTRNFNEILGFKTSAKVRAEISGISNYHLHSHSNCTELICVLNGEVSVYDFALEYKLSAGEIHICNSGDPHKIVSHDSNSCILIVQFEKDHYAAGYENLKLAYFVSHALESSAANSADMRYLRLLMAKIYKEYIKPEPSDFLLESLTRELIDFLYDHFHEYSYFKTENGYLIIRKHNQGQDENTFKRIYRIADYIESYYYKKLTLDEIAKSEYMNPVYLSRFIKQHLGVNFSELVSIARCSEVERLLLSTNRSIEQIAAEVGFSNRSHLTNQFIKWYGQTPAQYRKKITDEFFHNDTIVYHDIDAELSLSIINTYLNG